MSHNIRMTDNSGAVLRQLERNKRNALTAMGMEAVSIIQDGMDTLYGRPIWDTGDLHRSITYDVGRSGDDTVDVGTDIEYAPYVHEGTYKMPARPFIPDSLNTPLSRQALAEIAQEQLEKGF